MGIYELSFNFIIFIIYAFLGWSIETIGEIFKSKKLINRGFLLGPYCPVYGFGALLITAVLNKYNTDFYDFFIVFGMSMIICGGLEYFTSWIMEKLFKARWWDYSNYKFNINGRICLETMVLFGIAGILIIRVFNPLFSSLLLGVPRDILQYVSGTIFFLFVVDIIISLNIMNKIKNIALSYKNSKDNTEEISNRIRNAIMEKSLPYRRIISAFPQAFTDRLKKTAENIKENIIEAKEKTVEKLENVKEQAIDNINNIKYKTIENINVAKLKTNEARQKTIENLNQVKTRAMTSINEKKNIIKNIKGRKIRTINEENSNMEEK